LLPCTAGAEQRARFGSGLTVKPRDLVTVKETRAFLLQLFCKSTVLVHFYLVCFQASAIRSQGGCRILVQLGFRSLDGLRFHRDFSGPCVRRAASNRTRTAVVVVNIWQKAVIRRASHSGEDVLLFNRQLPGGR
jgi:hypothetical protein